MRTVVPDSRVVTTVMLTRGRCVCRKGKKVETRERCQAQVRREI